MDQAIHFFGTNWLILVDAYSKYSPHYLDVTKATTDLLEQDFTHLGNSHTIISDNAK